MKKPATIWRLYERAHIYPQSLSAYWDLFHLSPKKYAYLANHYEIGCYTLLKKGLPYFWWARDVKPLEKSARAWVNQWLLSKTKLNRYAKNFDFSKKQLDRLIPKYKNAEFAVLSLKNLYQIYKRTKKIFLDNLIFSEYPVDTFDDFYNQIFAENLQKISKRQITEQSLNELLQAAYVSESLKYKKEIYLLSLKKTINAKILQKITDRFYWIMMSWDGQNAITQKYAQNEIKRAKKEPAQKRKKEIRRIENFTKIAKNRRKKLLKKYQLSPAKLKNYFLILDLFIKFHDLRKETQLRCNDIIFTSLRHMSKNLRLPYEDLLFYNSAEIKNLCLHKLKAGKQTIKARQKGFTFIIEQGKVKTLEGSKARETLEKLVLKPLKAAKIKQVLGIPASKGLVKGRTKIVRSGREAVQKIKQGDILIASMTTVDYLQAMHLASAIVTDDGGISCHAAIISRELGVPCVVGTKTATQIFKDGDLVEVNANQGIIKLIKKQ